MYLFCNAVSSAEFIFFFFESGCGSRVGVGWGRRGALWKLQHLTAFDSAARRLQNMTDASFSSELLRCDELGGAAECKAPAEIVLDVERVTPPHGAQRGRGPQ